MHVQCAYVCNSSVCIRVLSTWAVDPDVSCLKTTCTLNRGLGEVLLSPLIALERACKEHLTFRRKASSTIQSIFSVYVTQCCCTWKHTHIHHTNTHILAAYHLLADTHTHTYKLEESSTCTWYAVIPTCKYVNAQSHSRTNTTQGKKLPGWNIKPTRTFGPSLWKIS